MSLPISFGGAGDYAEMINITDDCIIRCSSHSTYPNTPYLFRAYAYVMGGFTFISYSMCFENFVLPKAFWENSSVYTLASIDSYTDKVRRRSYIRGKITEWLQVENFWTIRGDGNAMYLGEGDSNKITPQCWDNGSNAGFRLVKTGDDTPDGLNGKYMASASIFFVNSNTPSTAPS